MASVGSEADLGTRQKPAKTQEPSRMARHSLSGPPPPQNRLTMSHSQSQQFTIEAQQGSNFQVARDDTRYPSNSRIVSGPAAMASQARQQPPAHGILQPPTRAGPMIGMNGARSGSSESVPRLGDGNGSDRSLPLTGSTGDHNGTAVGASRLGIFTNRSGTGSPASGRSALLNGANDSASTVSTAMPPTAGEVSAPGAAPLPRAATTENAASPSPRKGAMAPVNPALATVFRPLMDAIANHSQKLYAASPPELELIVARNPNGGTPKQGAPGSARNDWDSVWMQLIGNSLSVWSMKETQEADKRGERVPPTYYNITDSSLELLAPLPPPPHRPTSHAHPFVFSLNTAGSNRILLSCPSEDSLARWVTGLRLAAWEKSRIEEVYTGHALRTFIHTGSRSPVVGPGERATWNEPESPLVKGKLEGWVKVRVMGGTEWKRLWLVLTKGSDPADKSSDKKRRSFFGLGGGSDAGHSSASAPGVASSTSTGNLAGAMQTIASAVFFHTPPPKPTKGARQSIGAAPVLTITYVSQAYAVFPEHLEVVTSSNLFKIVGNISGDMVVVEGRPRMSGWAMIMPEREEEQTAPSGPPIADMLRWLVGFHDAFGLYGRPAHYDWDPKSPQSLFFAYPHAPGGARLFLETESAISVDYRHDVVAQVRRMFANLTVQRMNAPTPPRTLEEAPPAPAPPAKPRSPSPPAQNTTSPEQVSMPHEPFPLPPSDGQDYGFVSQAPLRSDTLTPITERSDVASRQTSIGTLNASKMTRGGSNSSKAPAATLSRNGSLAMTLDPAMVEETLSSPTSESPQDDTPRVSQVAIIPGPAADQQVSLTRESSVSQYSEQSPDRREMFAGPRQQESSPLAQAQPPPSMVSSPPAPAPAEIAPPILPTAVPPMAPAPIVAPAPLKTQEKTTASRLEDDRDETEALYLLSQANPETAAPQPAKQRPTIVTSFDAVPPPRERDVVSPSNARASLGRKPSGARAMPAKRQSSATSVDMPPIADDTAPAASIPASQSLNADAMAAMTFLDKPQSPEEAPTEPQMAVKQSSPEAFRSSFAPSQSAADRRARAQAEEQRKVDVLTKPGRGGAKHQRGNWDASSDEEESEEEEDEDEEAEPARQAGRASEPQSLGRGRPLPEPADVQRRSSRTLPPIPHDQRAVSMAMPSSRYEDVPQNRASSYSATARAPQRQTNLFNKDLDVPHLGADPEKTHKFVTLDSDTQMTKAFTPHGLLQAGLQDKEDRSARRQEEVAKETGSSLVNVPNKPPPPQTGLLGAITAHERDRQGAGGIGAALTERERDRRLAEERQRQIDSLESLQRQQMYGSPPPSVFGQDPYGRPMSQYGGMPGMPGMPSMPSMGYMVSCCRPFRQLSR